MARREKQQGVTQSTMWKVFSFFDEEVAELLQHQQTEGEQAGMLEETSSGVPFQRRGTCVVYRPTFNAKRT